MLAAGQRDGAVIIVALILLLLALLAVFVWVQKPRPQPVTPLPPVRSEWRVPSVPKSLSISAELEANWPLFETKATRTSLSA